MKSRSLVLGTAVALVAMALAGCAEQGGKNANVDDARLVEGSPDGANWLSYGRTMDEQRFSPLTQVTDQNVNQLGLEWSSDLDTARGQEATPIVVDGIMYISTAWSMVKAYDAATGKKLWNMTPRCRAPSWLMCAAMPSIAVSLSIRAASMSARSMAVWSH